MNILRMKNKALFLLLLVALLVANSCSKKSNPVPYTSVDFTLDLTLPSYSKLQIAGNWMYISSGTYGLIICNSGNGQANPFCVLDRTCTYNPTNGYVKVLSNNVLSVDSSCGSKFNIYNGNVQNGPATIGLKTYNSTYDGYSLHVYN